MAKRGVSVGVEITGSAKGFKAASEDAARANAKMERDIRAKNQKMEQSFNLAKIAIAKIGAAIAVAGVAFEVFKKVMGSTEGTADKFRESTDYAKGAVKGLFQTMAAGGWESFLTNIRLTAEATRDFGKAIDDLSDKVAGDKIQIGQWEGKLQEARLAYAEFKDSDSGKAKEAVADAIYYQKAITALTIQQLKERAKATEDYWFKKDNNLNKSQFDWVIKQFPLIAKSQRMLLDPEYMAGLEKANDAASKNMLAAIKNFIYFRDTLSEPNQFNTYIEGLGQIEEAAARGDQELVRLTKQLAAFRDEANKPIAKATVPGLANISGLMPKSVAGINGAAGLAGGPTSAIKDTTDALQKQIDITNQLTGVFVDMFSSIEDGAKGMVDSLIASIKRVVTELVAKAAVLTLLRMLFPGSEIGANATTGLMNMFGSKMFSGGSKALAMGAQNIKIGGQFQLKGADLYASAGRFGNMLNGST